MSKNEDQYKKWEEGMAATTRQSKLGMVLRVTSGNFLEMFDFFLSGVYASYIAKAFFPLENEYDSRSDSCIGRSPAARIFCRRRPFKSWIESVASKPTLSTLGLRRNYG
jgi:hypothetical protein